MKQHTNSHLCNGHMVIAGIQHYFLLPPIPFTLSKHFSCLWFLTWWEDSDIHS